VGHWTDEDASQEPDYRRGKAPLMETRIIMASSDKGGKKVRGAAK